MGEPNARARTCHGVLWRLGIFLAVCLFFLGAMFAIFAQLRFQREMVYRADFSNVSGLEEGNFVRIAGVEVGKVKQLTLRTDTTVSVEFSTDDSVVLTRGSRAVIRYNDLVGGRYLALEEGTGTTTALKPGDTIPLANTSPALDLDALIGGFRPLFRALDPDQVNALSSQLVAAFEGQGETIGSFFEQTAALTNMLADRDQLIGQVDRQPEHRPWFAWRPEHPVRQGGRVVVATSSRHWPSASRTSANSVAYANAAASSIADLLSQSRPAIQKVVTETDRTAGIVVADHDYFDNFLATLPDAYQALSRQGLYGDFFTFYCATCC